MSKMLKVVSVEERVSTTVKKELGKAFRYKVISVIAEGVVFKKDEATGNLIKTRVPDKRTSFNAWVDSPIPGRDEPEFGHDLVPGDLILGDIVTREVEKYFIPSKTGPQMNNGVPGRWVTQASFAVFGDTENKEEFDVEIARVARQRNFILKGAGDLGAPGGNLDIAHDRERTKMEGHDFRANLPHNLQDAGPGEINDYSATSAQRNADGHTTAG